MTPSVARSIQCAHCGAAIELAVPVHNVECPYCRQRQSIAPWLVAQLESYQRAVASGRQAASADAESAASWARWWGGSSQPASAWAWAKLLAFVYFGVPAVIGAVVGLVVLLAPDRETRQALIPVAEGGTLVAGVVLYVVWYLRKHRPHTARMAEVPRTQIVCPSCGALQDFVAGNVSQPCAHCHAPLVPSRTVAELGIDQVRAQARMARLAKVRAERTAYMAMYRWAVNDLLWVLTVPWIVLLGGTSIAMTVSWFTDPNASSTTPFAGLLFLWALTLALVGIVAAVVMWRRHRLARWRDAIGRLAGQFHGRAMEGAVATVAWLNAFWAAAWDPAELRPSRTHYGAAMVTDGYATLLVTDTTTPRGAEAFVVLALAAWVPGLSDGTMSAVSESDEARSIATWLGRSGFVVERSEGGIIAHGDGSVRSALHRHPEFVMGLAPIIAQLARFAKAVGAVPIAALPA